MKTKAFFLSATGLLLLASSISFAQNGKLAIGVDYGAGVIRYQPVYSYLGNGAFVDFHMKLPDTKLHSLSQFFLLTADVHLSSKVAATLEVSSPGPFQANFSRQFSKFPASERFAHRRDYRDRIGRGHLGLAFGLKWNLVSYK